MNNSKKLALSKQTLRILDGRDLTDVVVGGLRGHGGDPDWHLRLRILAIVRELTGDAGAEPPHSTKWVVVTRSSPVDRKSAVPRIEIAIAYSLTRTYAIPVIALPLSGTTNAQPFAAFV